MGGRQRDDAAHGRQTGSGPGGSSGASCGIRMRPGTAWPGPLRVRAPASSGAGSGDVVSVRTSARGARPECRERDDHTRLPLRTPDVCRRKQEVRGPLGQSTRPVRSARSRLPATRRHERPSGAAAGHRLTSGHSRYSALAFKVPIRQGISRHARQRYGRRARIGRACPDRSLLPCPLAPQAPFRPDTAPPPSARRGEPADGYPARWPSARLC